VDAAVVVGSDDDDMSADVTAPDVADVTSGRAAVVWRGALVLVLCAPVVCAPVLCTPVVCAPVLGAPVDCAPVDCAPVDCAPTLVGRSLMRDSGVPGWGAAVVTGLGVVAVVGSALDCALVCVLVCVLVCALVA
jgi:hypothetical protein